MQTRASQDLLSTVLTRPPCTRSIFYKNQDPSSH
nr:MAG TPA: hypothetical protein [Caudoviricetes sp.]